MVPGGYLASTHLSIMRKIIKESALFLCHVKPTGAGVTMFGPMLEYAS
jgi:hypothetical protein